MADDTATKHPMRSVELERSTADIRGPLKRFSNFLVVVTSCIGLEACAGKGSAEVLTVFGLISFLAYVPLTTLLLGIITAIVGAFLPSSITESTVGKATLSLGRTQKVSVAGTLRFAIVTVGMVIVVGALFQGASNVSAAQSAQATHLAVPAAKDP